MLVLVRKNKYRSITPKKFFDPELFGSSQLHGFMGKRVRARKKTGILKFYSDNPYYECALYSHFYNLLGKKTKKVPSKFQKLRYASNYLSSAFKIMTQKLYKNTINSMPDLYFYDAWLWV